jgi:hypothetical protein
MQVKFLYNKENEDLFAVFPTEIFNSIFGTFVTCYSQIGQHSACHPEYIKESGEAEPQQYMPLLNELKQIGYDDLEII